MTLNGYHILLASGEPAQVFLPAKFTSDDARRICALVCALAFDEPRLELAPAPDAP